MFTARWRRAESGPAGSGLVPAPGPARGLCRAQAGHPGHGRSFLSQRCPHPAHENKRSMILDSSVGSLLRSKGALQGLHRGNPFPQFQSRHFPSVSASKARLKKPAAEMQRSRYVLYCKTCVGGKWPTVRYRRAAKYPLIVLLHLRCFEATSPPRIRFSLRNAPSFPIEG